ncbi:MAG: RluA family pseudouridine synthase [Eubacteriales bacterium]|nr:RluA family pseudouridine synthase [Eubacteriales bacterium]
MSLFYVENKPPFLFLCVSIDEVHSGNTIRKFAEKELSFPASLLRSLKFLPSGISVNGQRRNIQYILEKGDLLRLLLEDSRTVHDHLLPFDHPVDVVFENEYLILLNKPAGLVVHPSHGHYADTLSNALAHYFMEKRESHTIRPIGRLDKDTSGLILFAKNQYAASFLEHSRAHGQLSRHYLALVTGCPAPAPGTVDLPIAPSKEQLNLMQVCEDGLPSRTDYRVLQSFEANELCPVPYSLVSLHLHTGRTHQIRVHMSAIGHPLLGDPIYGQKLPSLSRAALHSSELSGSFPARGGSFQFHAELPADMQLFISVERTPASD